MNRQGHGRTPRSDSPRIRMNHGNGLFVKFGQFVVKTYFLILGGFGDLGGSNNRLCNSPLGTAPTN
jgi:hypothetical protein